jgi:Ca2+-binding RTX toxin-like protein
MIFQHGLSGHDTITLGSGNDTIFEQGHATVTGAFGSATIAGGKFEFGQWHGVTEEIAHGGKATLVGGGGPTEFVGGRGSVSMVGGSGADTFVGGTGHDTMTGVGGSSGNMFEFLETQRGGHHVITNFTSGQDQLYLEGHSLAYLAKYNDVSSHDGNTYITLDGGKTTIELQGVAGLKDSDITTHKP